MDILGLVIIIIFSFLLLHRIAILNDILDTFRCVKCHEVNEVLNKKCIHCGSKMKKGITYKTLVFGRVNCKNDNKKFSRLKTLNWVLLDIAICLTAIIVGSALIIIK